MQAGKQCLREAQCAGGPKHCENPLYGFVGDDERVLRVIYSPKMYDVDAGAVLRAAFGIEFFHNGMSVDREQLIDREEAAAHYEGLANIRRNRGGHSDDLAQAVAAARVGDIRTVKDFEDNLFVCPSSRASWPPHADIHLANPPRQRTPESLKLMNSLYEVFESAKLEGVEFPL